MYEHKDSFIYFFIDEIKSRYSYHSLSAYGAQLAYFFILSLFPFLIFMIAILAHLSISMNGAINLLSKVAPKEAISIIDDYIRNILITKSTNILSISFIAAIWSASRAVNVLILSLNRAYGITKKRGFIAKRMLAIFYTLLVALSIVLALSVPNMGMDFLLWLSKFVGLTNFFITLWYYLRWVIIIAILFAVIGSLYYVAPNTKLSFIEVIPGTIFALIGWIIISLGFSFFVNNFRNFTIVYGSLAAVVVLMIWLYISGIILMLGGEINSIYRAYKEKSVQGSINA